MRQAFVEIGTSDCRFDIPHELLYDAVRQGARDALLQLVTDPQTGEPDLNELGALLSIGGISSLPIMLRYKVLIGQPARAIP